MTDAELVARCPRTLRIDPVLGLVKRCSRCGEWWTADRRFFGVGKPSAPLGLHPWCRCCLAESKANERASRREAFIAQTT